MVNEGSSAAAAEVVNFVERLELIREGQMKNYLYDSATLSWVRAPLVPPASAPMGSILQGAVTLSNIAATQFPAQACNTILIKASRDNTGVVYIGGAGVSNLNGYELEPSESIEVNVSNANLIYAISEVLSEKVRWLVVS
jgi:hypothetical protein